MNGGKPDALREQSVMTDGVHAPVNQTEPPDRDSVVDFVIRQTEAAQLGSRCHAVLAPRNHRYGVVVSTLPTFTGTIAVNVGGVGHCGQHRPGRVTAL